MDWIGDKDKCAVGCDCSVYTAKADGTLEIRGDNWKECPVDAGKGPCRTRVSFLIADRVTRPERDGTGKECRHCLRNPVRGRLDSQEQAISVAEEIERTFSEK